jgi:hypothetical protein
MVKKSPDLLIIPNLACPNRSPNRFYDIEALLKAFTGMGFSSLGPLTVDQWVSPTSFPLKLPNQVRKYVFPRYCQLKSNWADFLPQASSLNAEQSMSDEFVDCLNFGQIHFT